MPMVTDSEVGSGVQCCPNGLNANQKRAVAWSGLEMGCAMVIFVLNEIRLTVNTTHSMFFQAQISGWKKTQFEAVSIFACFFS